MAEQDPLFEKKATAVLIDGDNAQPSLIKEMLAEVSKYGRTFGCSSLKVLVTKLSDAMQTREDKQANGNAVLVVRFK